MNYTDFFSEDTFSFFRSPVREIFKRVNLSEIYSFAGGYPPREAFPVEEIREVADRMIATYGADCFQYGATQGLPWLREELAKRYKQPVERIQITSSSQQGIDICTRVLVDPGDVILTANPSYLGALQSFRSYRADIIGVAHQADIAVWETAWREAICSAREAGKKIKFLYMIPDFQNPSGETLTLRERELLVRLAEEYDFLIVEDAPYRELRYEGEEVATMYSLSPDRVLHLGSFSKVLAPGFRLGWILGAPELLDRIYVCKQSLDLCPPMLDQYIAAAFLSEGRVDENIARNRILYRHKRDRMLALLRQYMPDGCSWTHPEGGLFLYLTLPAGIEAVPLYEKALAAGVAYVAGEFFRTDGLGQNTIRLNYSFIPEEKMEEGIRRLACLLTSDNC